MSKIKFEEIEEAIQTEKPLEEASTIQIGRPTKVKGAKLDKKISCYFTSNEMELIDKARGGTAKATFVRELVLKEIHTLF